MAAMGSKEAHAYLIDPMNAPQPSEETGPGAHFSSSFAPAEQRIIASSPTSASSPSSNNPFRPDSLKHSSPAKTGANVSERPLNASPKERFPGYREEAFSGAETRARRSGSNPHPPPPYDNATPTPGSSSRRRTSSLRERYSGDDSHKPLDIIRRDSRKAHRSPHLTRRHMPGADMIDRLDPALGGRAYHHEGPYDVALLARNTDYENSPLAALRDSNEEALKATPAENIKDALERHQPLDGTAVVPPGEQDRFGRTYDYREGADLMREANSEDQGYKRWPGKEYDPEDFKGQSEPTFSLDRALEAHKIDDNGIEMEDRAHLTQDYHKAERQGTLDARDPVEIAGDDSKYAELENANSKDSDGTVRRTGSLRHAGESLKKSIRSLRHTKHDE